MKVLNIMTSALHYNGIGMSLLNYYRNIDENKIVMDFLVPNIVEEKLKQDFTIKGNKLFELEYNGKKMHQVRPIMYCRKLYKILRDEKYDIVHVHGSSSMLFLQLVTAKFAGVKVRIAHSRNTNADHNLLHKICKIFFKNSYTKAFACGKEAGEWLFGKKEDVTIIPNGKDCNMFEFKENIRNKYREKYDLKDKIVIGHVGNFNFQKNHDFLIDVFKELDKNYFLVLAGKGELENEIKEKVKRLNLENRVLFLGQISVEEVSNWLNAMDIMIFPSRYEGFPNVLIEWQMAGLPCIISSEITKDVKITKLVHFESLESEPSIWSEKIKKIKIIDRALNKDKILSEIRKNGYDIKENAKKLEEIYLGLVNKKDIIFISNYFGNGGAARVIQVLSKVMAKKYNVKIVTFNDDDKKYTIPDNVLYEYINTKSKNKMMKKIERILKLRKILKLNKDATIISFEYFVNMQTIVAKAFFKNKLIISERNDPNHVGNNKKRLRNFLYKFSDVLVCQTEDAKNYFPNIIQAKVIVIPNPIKSSLPRRFEGVRKKEIVTFCRIEKQKNLKMLVDAYEKLRKTYKDYKLIIYGDGSEKENLVKYIESKKIKKFVDIHPFQKNIHEKIVESSMFVSSSDYEGISNSMIEAMGIGLPVIVTDCPCGGARMMVENNVNGILIPVNDTNAMCQAMKKIIEDQDFAKEISQNATLIKNKLNEEEICKKWLNLI